MNSAVYDKLRVARGAILAEDAHRSVEIEDVGDRRVYRLPSATDPTVTYTVFVDENGQWVCIPCPDFRKRQQPCKHIFEVFYRFRPDLAPPKPISHLRQLRERGPAYRNARRNPIEQYEYDEGLAESTRRDHARMIQSTRVEELLLELGRAINKQYPSQTGRGRRTLPPGDRVVALVLRAYRRTSVRCFNPEINRLASENKIAFSVRKNTLLKYGGDPTTESILQRAFALAIQPFRLLETKFIVDSSGLSPYLVSNWLNKSHGPGDVRPNTRWIKWHALIGVESRAVLAYRLTASEGEGTGDGSSLAPLLAAISNAGFNHREYIVADNIYLVRERFAEAIGYGMHLVGPMKNRNLDAQGIPRKYIEPITRFQADNPGLYDELCRKRLVIEALFSAEKRRDNHIAAIGTASERASVDENPLFVSRRVEMCCRVIRQVLEKTVEQEVLRNRRVSYEKSSAFSHVREYSPVSGTDDGR